MKKTEYMFDDSFKENIRKEFETEVSKWNQQKVNMTPEEIAESIAEDDRRIAELNASIEADDPDGHFKNMMKSMHDPDNPLYKTYSHPNEAEDNEEDEFEVSLEDSLIIDDYKQYVFLEGVSPEEALELLGVEKVTENVVIWGDESEAERKEIQKIINFFGEDVIDPYTQEEKDARAKEIREMEAKGIDWKGGQNKQTDLSDPSTSAAVSTIRAVLITNLLDFIDADELLVENEDAFISTYESLPEVERKVLDMRLEGKPLRECGEVIGMSHEAIRKIERKVIEKLRAMC